MTLPLGRLAALGLGMAALALPATAAADTVTDTYTVPGTYTLTIPQYTTSVNVIANGAGGTDAAGGGSSGANGAGGVGAQVNETVPVGPGTPFARAGRAYAATLRANLGTTPYRWRVRSLPRGLRLRAGRIAGRPAHGGTYRLGVRVSDASHPVMRAFRRLTLKVAS
jgi:hypothetical protein